MCRVLQVQRRQGVQDGMWVAGCSVGFHVSLPRWGNSAAALSGTMGRHATASYVAEGALWDVCWSLPPVPWRPWGFGLGLVASLSCAAHASTAKYAVPHHLPRLRFIEFMSTYVQMWRVYQRGLERWIIDLLQPVFDGLIKDGTVPRFLQVSSWVTIESFAMTDSKCTLSKAAIIRGRKLSLK